VIRAVVFDGDQTLWDFQAVMHTALSAVLGELRAYRPGHHADELGVGDLVADRNEVTRQYEGIEFNLARLRHLGFARTLQRLREDAGDDTRRLAAAHDDDDDDVVAARLTTSYFAHRDRDPALFPDAVPCLDALRPQFRLGLLSNGSRAPDVIGLGGYFEAIVFAQDHRVAKPDPAIFAIAERQLGVGPDECVLVGDHPLNDVVGAKQSGWRAVWIDRDGDGVYPPPAGTAFGPDACITSLNQLPGVLRSL
jgi:HAD superfamily hydrolase (TIGR01509 family)